MERGRKWRRGAALCDLYTASVEGGKSKSVSLSAPLVCSPIVPVTILSSKIHVALLGNNRTRCYLSPPKLLPETARLIYY